MISPGLASAPGFEHDERDHFLAHARVRLADDGGLCHGWVTEKDLLDLARIDVVAAADHQVLLAVDDEQIAVLVDISQVAGVEPATGERLGGLLRPPVIGLHHVVAADDDLADVLRARRERLVLLVQSPGPPLPRWACRCDSTLRCSALTLKVVVLAVSDRP